MSLRKSKRLFYTRPNKIRVLEMWGVCKDCYWCGEETVLSTSNNEGEQFPNTATFDHLYTNLDKRRHTGWGKHAGVLACYKCNHKRGGYEWFQNLSLIKQLIILSKMHKKFKFLRRFLYGS